MFRPLAIPLVLTAALLPASAVTLVNDTFTDGGRTNGADPLDAAWFKNNSSETLTVTSNELIQGTAGTTFVAITGTMPSAVSLLNIGDYIQLDFTFRYLTAPGTVASGFRFGLYNSNGQVVTADTGTATDANSGNSSLGYYASVSTGTGTYSNAFYRESGGGSGILSGTDRSTAVASGSTDLSLDDTTSHTGTLLITVSSATQVTLSGNIDGTSLGSGIANITTNSYRTFNQIAFSNNNANTQMALDNILVTSNIPEPGTSLLGCCGFLLLCLRRRK